MIDPLQDPAIVTGKSSEVSSEPAGQPDTPVGHVTQLLYQPMFGVNGELVGVIIIEDEGTGPILIARWLMQLPQKDVMVVFMRGLELFEQYGCKAYLNDGSAAASDWNELIPWVEYDMLPRGLMVGVRAVAVVHKLEPAESLAFYKVMQYVNQFVTMQSFASVDTARSWLREQLRAK